MLSAIITILEDYRPSSTTVRCRLGCINFAENCERSYDILLESEIEAKNWFLRTLVEVLVVIYGHLISFKAKIKKFVGLF